MTYHNPATADLDDHRNPDLYTDSGRLALQARSEYEALTPDERARVELDWDSRSEWEREQIRAAVEFDLL